MIKGQLYMHVKALEFLWLKTNQLPCNVKIYDEGEEGSLGLAIWLFVANS